MFLRRAYNAMVAPPITITAPPRHGAVSHTSSRRHSRHRAGPMPTKIMDHATWGWRDKSENSGPDRPGPPFGHRVDGRPVTGPQLRLTGLANTSGEESTSNSAQGVRMPTEASAEPPARGTMPTRVSGAPRRSRRTPSLPTGTRRDQDEGPKARPAGRAVAPATPPVVPARQREAATPPCRIGSYLPIVGACADGRASFCRSSRPSWLAASSLPPAVSPISTGSPWPGGSARPAAPGS